MFADAKVVVVKKGRAVLDQYTADEPRGAVAPQAVGAAALGPDLAATPARPDCRRSGRGGRSPLLYRDAARTRPRDDRPERLGAVALSPKDGYRTGAFGQAGARSISRAIVGICSPKIE